jgi:flagellar L-ring protein precursor FlgH
VTVMLKAFQGAVVVFGSCLAVAGCSDIESKVYSTPTPVPVLPKLEQPSPGAIGTASQNLALFEDTKAHNVGDLITINLVESMAGSKKASADASKADADSIGNISIFGKTIHTNGSYSSSRSFKGSGDAAQSNTLTGSITAVVTQRLGNGNLMIRGEKQVELNQGLEFVRIEGIVRTSDIAADNSVLSSRVADARISYTGKGQVNDATAQGWLARFFNSPWMPF